MCIPPYLFVCMSCMCLFYVGPPTAPGVDLPSCFGVCVCVCVCVCVFVSCGFTLRGRRRGEVECYRAWVEMEENLFQFRTFWRCCLESVRDARPVCVCVCVCACACVCVSVSVCVCVCVCEREECEIKKTLFQIGLC